MRRVRPTLALVLLAALAALAGACASRAPADPALLADQVMEALGGRTRWDSLPGLRWTFASTLNDSLRFSRSHAWDRGSGRHRVEGVNRQGQRFVIVHTVGDTTGGLAWVDGQRIEDPDSLRKLVKRGEQMWVNDAYWLLMPYKLRDPGVTLASAGDTTVDGRTYDRLALSFSGVGLTPGDHYWVWVNRANRRIERWDMVLESQQPPPVSYTWEGWQEHGGLWFATAHRRDSINVITDRISPVARFEPSEFEQP